MRVVGIVAPFAPRGGGPVLGEIRLIEPTRVLGTWNLYLVPQAAVRQRRASQKSGTGPCGDCRRDKWVPSSRRQYSGGNLFYRETWGTRIGCRHVAKRSSDPWVAYPEVKVQVQDLVRIVGIIGPLPQEASVFGKNSFYRAPMCKWAQETCVRCPQHQYAMGEPCKDQVRDLVGIVEGSCGYRARGISIQGAFVFIEKPRVQY